MRYVEDYSSPEVDVSLSRLNLKATNIRNINDESVQLPPALHIVAITNGGGTLATDGRFNILGLIPDVDIDVVLEKVDLTSMNDLFKAYVNIDAERGVFNLYTELVILEGQLTEYVNPLVTDLQVVDFNQDKDQPLRLVWEGVVSAFLAIFENQEQDKTGVKMPLQGDLNDPDVEL